MSANDKTKYYWLKLDKDFFQNHRIRVIEGMKNGKEYVLFYLKIMVEATAWEGELRFSADVPYTEEMLANLTGTPIDTVHTALEVFEKLGMAERWGNGTIFIPEVRRITGSETGATIRQREYRKSVRGDTEATMSPECRQEIRD